MPAGLDELGRARLAEGRRILTELSSEQQARIWRARAEAEPRLGGPGLSPADVGDLARGFAAFMATGRLGPGLRPEGWGLDVLLPALSAEQQRCLLFAAAERCAQTRLDMFAAECLSRLKKVALSLETGDARVLAAAAEPGLEHRGYYTFSLVAEVVQRLITAGAPGAEALAETVADQVLGWNAMDHVRPDAPYRHQVAKLRDTILDMAGRPPAPPATEGPVGRDDGFGRAVIGLLGLVEDWPAGLADLLGHCATAKSARPGARWEQRCRQRLGAVDDAGDLLRGLLELIVTTAPVSYLTDHGRWEVLIGYNEQLVRGLVWAAGVIDPPWLPEVLRDVAVRCLRLCAGNRFRQTPVPGEKVPYACFYSLARSSSDDALIALTAIGRATTNRSVTKQLGKMLEEAGARRGMSAASLVERLTPDHGLDSSGQASVVAGGATWTVGLDDRQGAVLTGPQAPVPREAATLLAEVRETVAMTRARLDGFFADRREWHVDDFAECYLRHPLTGWLATRLVWTFTPESGEPVCGFPGSGAHAVRTVHGERPISRGSLVQLLHPVRTDTEELGRLRRLSADLGITQPIRQLWRETYRLTTHEQDNGLYSDRYAGHILRFRQFYGLARSRGWGGGFLSSTWDGGHSALARRDYPAIGLRASWEVAGLLELSDQLATELCQTGRLAFSPLDDVVRTPVPLAEVPAEVFSEAMRDLSLLVSVTTVANDPVWLEGFRGHRDLGGYWDRLEQGGLRQLKTQRGEVLAPFFSQQTSGRYDLTEDELLVRGSLATYRIDLATANVRMEPAGKWLSFDTRISPDDSWRQGILGLPDLDDDEILHRILIRAAILADDEQLADTKLLKQIRG